MTTPKLSHLLCDVVDVITDYRVPIPLFCRYFTLLTDGQTKTSSDSGPFARLYRVDRDVSKQKHFIGAVVYNAEIETKMSFKPPDDCNLLLAKISAIKKAVKWLRCHKKCGKDTVIVTDSRSKIIFLTNMFTKLNLIHECWTYRNEMALHSNITLQWVCGQ